METGNPMNPKDSKKPLTQPPAKKRLATVWLTGCSGCHMSFLDLDEWLFESESVSSAGVADEIMSEASET